MANHDFAQLAIILLLFPLVIEAVRDLIAAVDRVKARMRSKRIGRETT